MAFTVNTSVTTQQTLSATEDFGVVTQNGAISLTATCVLMSGEDARLVNGGLIASGGDVAVSAANDARITNTGTIVGYLNAISVNVEGSSDSSSRIVNHGEITSYGGRAIIMADAGASITNYGTISGNTGGITIGSSAGVLVSFIVNTGTIAAGEGTVGSSPAIQSFGTLRMENAGLILGRIILGTGGDIVDNRLGEISGQIAMGSGNNLFRGGDGDEEVTAGSASDTLRGGDGDDTITGGGGSDLLAGGRGADSFVFTQSSDSMVGTTDLIRSFDRKEDVIDISALAATPFAFTGKDPLAGGGAPSVGYARNGDVLTVSADVTGDGVGDLVFQLTGTRSLAADNFIL